MLIPLGIAIVLLEILRAETRFAMQQLGAPSLKGFDRRDGAARLSASSTAPALGCSALI